MINKMILMAATVALLAADIAKADDPYRGRFLGYNEKGYQVWEKENVKYVLLPGKDQHHDYRVIGNMIFEAENGR